MGKVNQPDWYPGRRNTYCVVAEAVNFDMVKAREIQKEQGDDLMACDVESHKKHMCALKTEGNDECIRSLSDNPTVECSNCGAKANEAKNLCAPEPLPVL